MKRFKCLVKKSKIGSILGHLLYILIILVDIFVVLAMYHACHRNNLINQLYTIGSFCVLTFVLIFKLEFKLKKLMGRQTKGYRKHYYLLKADSKKESSKKRI